VKLFGKKPIGYFIKKKIYINLTFHILHTKDVKNNT
jgi:hypothetical protein